MPLIVRACVFFASLCRMEIAIPRFSDLFLRGRLRARTFEDDLPAQLEWSGKSLIRWGDGESACLMGGHIYFQKTNARLRKYLHRILLEYSDGAPYILGMPLQFFNATRCELVSIGKHKTWEHTRTVFYLFCPKNAKYADSLTFRPDKVTRLSDGYLDPRMLWSSVENISLLHPRADVYRAFCHLNLGKTVFWIAVPEQDALDQFEQLLFNVEELAQTYGLTRQNSRILLSVGPTAKALAYVLPQRFICYDLGHFFDFAYGGKRTTKEEIH